MFLILNMQNIFHINVLHVFMTCKSYFTYPDSAVNCLYIPNRNTNADVERPSSLFSFHWMIINEFFEYLSKYAIVDSNVTYLEVGHSELGFLLASAENLGKCSYKFQPPTPSTQSAYFSVHCLQSLSLLCYVACIFFSNAFENTTRNITQQEGTQLTTTYTHAH
jgi:hypothetical protein